MLPDFSRLLPGAIRRSYAVKFTLGLVGIALVVSVLGGAIWLNTGTVLAQDTEERVDDDATVEAQQVDGYLRRINKTTERTSITIGEQGDSILGIASILGEATNSEPVRTAYYLNETTGRVIKQQSGAGITVPLVGVAGRFPQEELEKVRALTPSDDTDFVGMTEPIRVSDSKPPTVLFVSHVPGTGDRAVVLEVDLRAFSNASLAGVDRGTFYVADEETGRILLSEDGSTRWTVPSAGAETTEGRRLYEAWRDVGLPTAGEGEVPPGEGSVITGRADLEEAEWVVVRGIPTEQAFTLREDILTQIVGIVGIVLGGFFFIGLTIGRGTVRSVNRLAESARELEQGELDVEIDVDRDDDFGDLARAFAEMRDSLSAQIKEARSARRDAEAAREEAERRRQRLQRRADRYGEVMAACANGDLTRRLDADGDSEAMDRIASSFNDMIEDLEATVHATEAFATQVTSRSVDTAHRVTTVRDASEQVAESMQAVTDEAEHQRETLQSVSTEMEDLSSTTEEIAASSNEVAEIAAETATIGRQASDAAEKAIEGMSEIDHRSERAVEAIDRLDAQTEAIDDLIVRIEEIADQTNMLALNANIEASRSGNGGGEGFGVVAGEIKDLADEAKDAAEEVNRRLQEIAVQTDTATDEVRGARGAVDTHAGAVESAATALDTIADYAAETSEGVQDITAATEEQAASVEEVVSMSNEAASIATDTTAEAGNVAAAAEEQTANLNDVAETVDVLRARAQSLDEAVASFQTSNDIDTATGIVDVEPPESGDDGDTDTNGADNRDLDIEDGTEKTGFESLDTAELEGGTSENEHKDEDAGRTFSERETFDENNPHTDGR